MEKQQFLGSSKPRPPGATHRPAPGSAAETLETLQNHWKNNGFARDSPRPRGPPGRPPDGAPEPATVTSKTFKNQWENSNSLVPANGCDCSRDPAPHARRSHAGVPGPATVTSKTYKNQWENSNSLVPVTGCDCSRDPAPHARRSHPGAPGPATVTSKTFKTNGKTTIPWFQQMVVTVLATLHRMRADRTPTPEHPQRHVHEVGIALPSPTRPRRYVPIQLNTPRQGSDLVPFPETLCRLD